MAIYKDDEKHAIRTLAARFEAGHIGFLFPHTPPADLGMTAANAERIIETLARFNLVECRDVGSGVDYRITAECVQVVREWDTERKRKRNEFIRLIVVSAMTATVTLLIQKWLK